MMRRVLRRHIWGYSVCLCPIKRTPDLYGFRYVQLLILASKLIAYFLLFSSVKVASLPIPYASFANVISQLAGFRGHACCSDCKLLVVAKDKKIKIKKLCLTSRFETNNVSSVELLLRHNE